MGDNAETETEWHIGEEIENAKKQERFKERQKKRRISDVMTKYS